jgi:outer membrane protein assembly factor BamB
MTTLTLAAAVILGGATAMAEDWPTYRHDNKRSAVSSEGLAVPLAPAWVYTSPTLPQPAWEGPAKWDAYSTQANLKSMRNFDPVYHVTSVGDAVYFGSSAEDAAICLDAATGAERWAYLTDGAVRVAPTWDAGKLYFGADDGHAYCVDAATGALVWRVRARADGDRLLPVNGKLVSTAPVRTGVLVQGGRAYFAGSLLPWDNTYLCAVDAATGALELPGTYRKDVETVAFQGALLASNENLYVLQGRSAPVYFSLDEGKRRGVAGGGGVFALLTEDDTLVAGSESPKSDAFSETEQRDKLATYEGANRMIVSQGVAYLQSGSELSAFERARYLDIQREINVLTPRKEALEKTLKELNYNVFKPEGKAAAAELNTVKAQIDEKMALLPGCFRWRAACPYPHDLILAGDLLFTGGDNAIAAYDTKDGSVRWTAEVEGKVHGLAAANGRLYVSTDLGKIYCFTAAPGAPPQA